MKFTTTSAATIVAISFGYIQTVLAEEFSPAENGIGGVSIRAIDHPLDRQLRIAPPTAPVITTAEASTTRVLSASNNPPAEKSDTNNNYATAHLSDADVRITTDKVNADATQQSKASHSHDELPNQLIHLLLNAPHEEFGNITSQTLAYNVAEVRSILMVSSESLRNFWSAASYGATERQDHLERLLWVINRLPTKDKATELGNIAEHYTLDSAAQEDTSWWKGANAPPAGAKEKAWLKETETLAGAGIQRAQYTLGNALLNGKLGIPDSLMAGELYSTILSNMSSGTLKNDDIAISNAILRQIDAIALLGDDRIFARAVTPGLITLANTNNPAAIWLLANITACRQTPPRLEETRNLLVKLSRISDWGTTANKRLDTINDPQWCVAYSHAKQGRGDN